MKNVMKYVALLVFTLFAVVVFALMASFSFSAIGRVYPGNLLNQAMGLVLFDFGALAWLVVFVYKAEGGLQRAGALVLFVLDFLGTLGLVSIEVLLGGQSYVTVAPWVGQSLVYVFIAATVANLFGVYFHHLSDSHVQNEIESQSQADAVIEEARRQADESIKNNIQSLGAQLAGRLTNDVRARLDLPALAEELFDAPVGIPRSLPVDQLGEESHPTL